MENKQIQRKRLETKEYKIIYADPAWVYKDKANAGNRGACHKYTLTPTEEMGKILDNIPVAKDSTAMLLRMIELDYQIDEGEYSLNTSITEKQK